MSIRIHKLAEELGLDNKEMMALLKERRIIGQDVKSVSSTVDKISAAALREEFAARQPAPAAAAATPVEPAAPAAETPAADAGPPRVGLEVAVVRCVRGACAPGVCACEPGCVCARTRAA